MAIDTWAIIGHIYGPTGQPAQQLKLTFTVYPSASLDIEAGDVVVITDNDGSFSLMLPQGAHVVAKSADNGWRREFDVPKTAMSGQQPANPFVL